MYFIHSAHFFVADISNDVLGFVLIVYLDN